MEGQIVSFRRGRKTVNMNQVIIKVDGVESKDATASLIGKKATFKTPSGKELVGQISAAHGTKGAVRAIFTTGMPGQSIGQKVVLA